jgi:hypothetical protein
MHRPRIGVFPPEGLVGRKRLLEALTQLYSVEFVTCQELDRRLCEAALLFGVTREQAVRIASSGLRCMAFLDGEPAPVQSASPNISLASIPYLRRCFQGRVLPDKTVARICRLKEEVGDEVVARKGDEILWIHRKEGVSAVDLVGVEPPHFAEGDYLFNHFQKDDWARLLPTLHFLREVSGWEIPPLRSCIMFDDPNLHWKSYGYVQYRQLIQHARKHNYHAASATVPMDGWYVHPETATLFRENMGQISLLIHGNNHTYFELAEAHTEVSRQALAAQALRRIERLERSSGLEVSRIMAAPHGACSYDMGSVLLRTGFEAACISRSSLMVRNPNVVWPITIGLNPAEFLGIGLPIIPRFNIRWDPTYVIFAAFLGQPIIPVGHHDDLAGGLDLLQQLAGLINSVGEVRWADMKSIAQTNFCTCREGDILYVKMYSRKIRLKVPDGIRHLCIQQPWLTGDGGEGLILQRRGSVLKTIDSYQGEPISVTSSEEMVISSIYPHMIDPRRVKVSPPPLWAIARRQLCEVRDRLKPFADTLFAPKNGKL